MTRTSVIALFWFSLLTITSCTFTIRNVRYWNPNFPLETNFVTQSMISKGEELQKKFPNEDYVYERVSVNYSFSVDEKLLKAQDQQGKISNKKEKKKKKKKIQEEEDEEMMESADEIKETAEDKTMIESDWPESPVTVKEKNEISVIALKDKLNYYDGIDYSDNQSVSVISGTYGHKENSIFFVSTYNKNMEIDGIFHSDAKIALMNVPMYVKGNSLQLNYTRTYHDYRYVSSVYLVESAPCTEKVVSFEIPEGLDIEILEMNFEGYDITRTEGEVPQSEPEDKERSNKKSKSKSKTKKKKSRKKLKELSKNSKRINYVIKNTPGYGYENSSYGPSHSLPHLLVLTKGYSNGKDTTALMSNSDDLYKWYSTLVNKMDNETDKIKEAAKNITVDKTTDEEKISAIFYWVQDNIRYLAFEDGIAAFKPDECQNVYEKRYGDCKGMANLTKEMLKSLGYDARLVWIGTSRIAYPGDMPSLSVANHMICAVYLDNKVYFLDATENYVSFGDYADRIQGRKVVIENGDSAYIVETIPSFTADHNKIESTEDYSLTNGLLTGTVKEIYNGESKTLILRSYNDVKLDKRERALRGFLTNGDNMSLTVSDVKHSDFNERNKPFEITYKMNAKGRALADGTQTLVNLEWERDWANAYMDTARLTHYSFYYKQHLVNKINFTVPQGMSVVRLPQEVTIINEYFVFKLNFSQQGNTITYNKEIVFPKGYLHRSQLKAWNDAITKVTNFYDSYIILKK
ncbi:MAG TPA: transglutaminase domain-containing protein [Bacteroidia bacterium]|nr:transglutaminase domain-containing protein [Bacteroidia bacterium]